jgi:GT2 family glycosyltransferase
MKNRVAVSILSHNSAQSTIACVQSLLAAEKAAGNRYQLDIFISDNASNAEDQQQLQQFLQESAKLHLRLNSENLGFSAGHNRNLVTVFANSSPNYVWLLNNDCLVAEQTLRALIECAHQQPEVGIWGATLLESNGETIQCAGGCFYNPWISSYRKYGHNKSLAQLDQLQILEYDYIAGASLFFPVATLLNGLRPPAGLADNKSTGQQQWLNESFFLYFEELDLARRLKSGLRIAWCRDALITHTAGASTGTNDNQRSALAEYHSTLSALKFTRLYYPRRLWMMAPVRYLAKSTLLLVRGDFRLIGVMTRAYWDFWTD